MKNTLGFTHWAIAILISIMALGLVGAAWYYEAHRGDTKTNMASGTTSNANASSNTTTVATTNGAINAATNAEAAVDQEVATEGDNNALTNTSVTETEETAAETTNTATPEQTFVTKTAKYIYNDVMPTSLTTQNEYSIATAAQVRKPEGITLSDIEVTLYDSPLLDTQYGKGRVSDVQCNSQYCLMTIRSAGWQYRVLRFENGTFTDLSGQIPCFDSGQISQMEFAWNGSDWLVDARDHLYKYDGSNFTEINLDLGQNQVVSTMAWNGSYWLVAVDMTCCLSSNSELLHLDSNGTVTNRIPILTNLNYPRVYSMYWGNNSWVIGAGEQDDKANKRQVKILKYTGSSEPDDISGLLPSSDSLRFEHLFWNGSAWLMHFIDIGAAVSNPLLYSYNGTTITDVSSMLLGFGNTSISTISGRPDFYTITGYNNPVANVVSNGQVRDLSGYFAMYVYSGSTYGNQVFIGGDSELEILTFHYEPKRVYTSEKVNDGSSSVTAVTLKPTQETPVSTAISYEVSQDGGQTWQAATANQQVSFSGNGADLRWQATLTTSNSSQTPSISFMEIYYITTE